MTGDVRAALAAILVAFTMVGLRRALRATACSTVSRRLAPSPETSRPTMPSGGAVVERIERLAPVPAWLPALLGNAGIDVSPARAWAAWLITAAAAVVSGMVLGGLAMAALAAVVVTVAPMAALRASRDRGPARIEAALPDGLEAVARALRSGGSLRQAVDEAARRTPGPLGEELGLVASQVSHGQPLSAALEGFAARRPLSGVRLAVAALCLGAETGGAQARAIDSVATTIRERLGVAAEARALASQARMSALVIGVAPVGFGVFAASTDPRTAQFLLHTPAGLAMLAAGLALDGLGWLWMQRLCRVPA